MSDIILDRDTHVYTQNGRVLRGVTAVLKTVTDFSMVPRDALAFACARGQAVHKAIELYHQGALDFSTLDDEVMPRLRAYMHFLNDSGYTPILNEHIVHHHIFDYCGMLDTYGRFGNGALALIDYKTGAVEAPAALQTAAYHAALSLARPEAHAARRYALWLGVDEYRLIPFTDARDWPVFQSLLNWHKWSETNGRRRYS